MNTFASLPPGMCAMVLEPTSGWTAHPRPTTRADIPVFFKGPDQPVVIFTAADTGMQDGIDTWIRTP